MQPYPGLQPAPQMWLPPGPDLPERRWQRQSKWWVIAFSVVLALILAIIATVALVLSATFSSEGRIRLPEALSTQTTDGSCRGSGLGSDLRVGTPVRVLSSSRSVLASGSIDTATQEGLSCLLHYRVGGIPAGQGQYFLQIADATEQVSETELRNGVDVQPSG